MERTSASVVGGVVATVKNTQRPTNQQFLCMNVGSMSTLIGIGYPRCVVGNERAYMSTTEYVNNMRNGVRIHHVEMCPRVNDLLNPDTAAHILNTNVVSCPHLNEKKYKVVGVTSSYQLKSDGADPPERVNGKTFRFKAMHYNMQINNKHLLYITDYLVSNCPDHKKRRITNFEMGTYLRVKNNKVKESEETNKVLLGMVHKLAEFSNSYNVHLKQDKKRGWYAEKFEHDHIAIVANARYVRCTNICSNDNGEKNNNTIVIKVIVGNKKMAQDDQTTKDKPVEGQETPDQGKSKEQPIESQETPKETVVEKPVVNSGVDSNTKMEMVLAAHGIEGEDLKEFKGLLEKSTKVHGIMNTVFDSHFKITQQVKKERDAQIENEMKIIKEGYSIVNSKEPEKDFLDMQAKLGANIDLKEHWSHYVKMNSALVNNSNKTKELEKRIVEIQKVNTTPDTSASVGVTNSNPETTSINTEERKSFVEFMQNVNKQFIGNGKKLVV